MSAGRCMQTAGNSSIPSLTNFEFTPTSVVDAVYSVSRAAASAISAEENSRNLIGTELGDPQSLQKSCPLVLRTLKTLRESASSFCALASSRRDDDGRGDATTP